MENISSIVKEAKLIGRCDRKECETHTVSYINPIKSEANTKEFSWSEQIPETESLT